MKLRFTIAFKEVIRIQCHRKLTRKIFNALVNFLENSFGSPLLVEVPEYLQDQNPKTWRALEVAHKLKHLGIVDNVVKMNGKTDEPFMHLYVVVPVSKMLIKEGGGGGGYDFFNEEKAIWCALGEAVERYLWFSDFYKGKVVRASYRELKGRALNIFKLAGFSDNQKNQMAKFLSFDEKTVLGWIKVRSLTSRKKMFCPIQLLSARYFREKVKEPKNLNGEEPLLRWSITTGSAAGSSLEEALAKGILETIERDAFMITFLNKISPPTLNLDELVKQNEDIRKIIKNLKRYNLDVHLLRLPTDFPVWVIATLLVDRSGLGPAFSIGIRASFNLKTSLIDSLRESLAVRDWQIRNQVEKIKLDNIEPKNIRTRQERLAYWAKIENFPKLDFLFQGKNIEVNTREIKDDSELEKGEVKRKEYYRKKLKYLTHELKQKKYEACYIDLTTPGIKKLGMRSVFVLIPQLQPMSLIETIPYFGGFRLKEIPKKFGYEPAETLNEEPQPLP